jgi:hypothetical protein
MPPTDPNDPWLSLAYQLGRWAARQEFERLERLRRGEKEPEEEPADRRLPRRKVSG